MLTISPTHSSALTSRPRASKRGPRLLLAVLVDDLHPGPDLAQRAGALARFPIDGNSTFGGSVRIDDVHAEPPGERVHDLGRAFVAERHPQRVVGVVRVLGLREEVAERLARVVEVGRAVVAHVGATSRDAENLRASPTLAP